MAEPRIVSAVAVSVGRSSTRTAQDDIAQEAMRAAATKASADGVTNPAEFKRLMLAARDEVR